MAADLGVRIDAVRGKGYRITGGLDLLDAAIILSSLSPVLRERPLVVDLFDQVDSTNAVALSRVRAGDCSDYACLAEHQTAGRGRRGRRWISPFASNIYLSVTHEFAAGFTTIDGLSLAVGVSVCEALESLGLDGLGLKWPNDLVFRGSKVGGILIEVAGDVGGACQAVIGIGINVSMTDREAADIDQGWTDLRQIGLPRGRRNDVAVALLDHTFRCIDEFERDGLPAFLPRWRRFDALLQRKVDVITGSEVLRGRVQGVDSKGSLVVVVDGVTHLIRSGEVSVRNWQ